MTDAKAWMSYNGNDLPERFLLEKKSGQMDRKSEYMIPERILSVFYQYRAPKKLFHIKKMFLDPEAEKIEK